MDNLNPSEINAQIHATVERAKEQAGGKKIVYDRNELIRNAVSALEAVNYVNSMFTMVREMANYFDLSFLEKEGKSDLTKLNSVYYRTLGEQIVRDVRSLAEEATQITKTAKPLNELYVVMTKCTRKLNEDETLAVSVDSIEIQTQCADFALKFQSVVTSAIIDIITHLNTTRSAEDQIKTNLGE